jgi:hypothetical protein
VDIRLLRILNELVCSERLEDSLKEYERLPYVHRDFEDTVLVKV